MTEERFTLSHDANGDLQIDDLIFISGAEYASWHPNQMGIEEAERIVRLMNEMDRRHRLRAGLAI